MTARSGARLFLLRPAQIAGVSAAVVLAALVGVAVQHGGLWAQGLFAADPEEVITLQEVSVVLDAKCPSDGAETTAFYRELASAALEGLRKAGVDKLTRH